MIDSYPYHAFVFAACYSSFRYHNLILINLVNHHATIPILNSSWAILDRISMDPYRFWGPIAIDLLARTSSPTNGRR